MCIHLRNLVQISCPPEFVHVSHGRDASSLPNLRVANPLNLRDAKDRTKTGVVTALQSFLCWCAGKHQGFLSPKKGFLSPKKGFLSSPQRIPLRESTKDSFLRRKVGTYVECDNAMALMSEKMRGAERDEIERPSSLISVERVPENLPAAFRYFRLSFFDILVAAAALLLGAPTVRTTGS